MGFSLGCGDEEIIPDNLCRHQCNHKGVRRRQKDRVRGHVTTEAVVRVIRGHGPRNAGSLRKLGKARKHISPKASGSNATLLAHF